MIISIIEKELDLEYKQNIYLKKHFIGLKVEY